MNWFFKKRNYTEHTLWNIQTEIDMSATAKLYSKYNGWDCTCTDCQNFIALAKERKLPEPILKLLSTLAIPPEKATYVCNNYHDEQGYHYQFNYRVVGNIHSPETDIEVKQPWGEVYIGHDPYPYVAPRFPKANFDIMFFVTLPWVIDQPQQ